MYRHTGRIQQQHRELRGRHPEWWRQHDALHDVHRDAEGAGHHPPVFDGRRLPQRGHLWNHGLMHGACPGMQLQFPIDHSLRA